MPQKRIPIYVTKKYGPEDTRGLWYLPKYAWVSTTRLLWASVTLWLVLSIIEAVKVFVHAIG